MRTSYKYIEPTCPTVDELFGTFQEAVKDQITGPFRGALDTALEEADDEISALQEELDEAQEDKKAIQTKLEKANERIDQLKEEKDALRAEIQELRCAQTKLFEVPA